MKTGTQTLLIINPKDNVGIVPQTAGIQAGTILNGGIEVKEFVPMGHKIALADLPAGTPVVRYGHVIGYARTPIYKGSWVGEHQLVLPPPPPLGEIQYSPAKTNPLPPLEGFSFDGYRNKDGSVGTKNMLGITTSVQCVAGVTNYVVDKIRTELLPKYPNVDDVEALNHNYGCGIAIDAPTAVIPIRTIRNIALNPNFGGEVMVIGLGCEKLRPEKLVSSNHKDASILYLQDDAFEGFDNIIGEIMQTADLHLQRLNERRRTNCPASALTVGMQCGGSDAFSGITGNPVAGFAADLIVRAGGTVFFSEVTEVRDAIQQLVARAESKEVADALKAEMDWYDNYLQLHSVDRSANTTPGNKAGGLSNIIEKALGSVVKSGSSPITAVVGPGERAQKPGLNFVATPASDFVCGTLQVAAGMNVHVFITGRGTPYGLRSVPVIKVSSNSRLAGRWFDLIDFNAGPIAEGSQTIEDMGWELFHLILDVASGKRKIATDTLGLFNDLTLFNPGPLT